MTETFAHGIFSFLAFAIIVGLFFTAWQHIVIDAVRQRVFEIRDRAFLWAYDHEKLDDEAYREFRDMTNATIRMYENTSILRVIVINKIFNLDAKIRESDFAFFANEHLSKQFHKLTKVCGIGLILRSPIALAILAALLPVAALSQLLNGRPSISSGKVATALSKEVEADILIAASA